MDHFVHENVEIQPNLQVRFLIYEENSIFVTNHWHNSLEILYIKSGSMKVWINDNSYLLRKDDFIIINSRDIHATECLEPSTIQLLQIPYPILNAKIPDIDYMHFDPNVLEDVIKRSLLNSQIVKLLYDMGEVYQSNNIGYALKFSSILFELLYLLVNDCRIDISSTMKSKNDSNRERLMLIINYIKLHYAEPISLKDAASLVSLNPEYFCRFFKKNMGTTFLDYLNEVRLANIYRDIIDTDKTITQLLELHGFTNYKLFIKMFRTKYGCTPRKKRKS